jgi:hypothetical protein
MNDWSFGWTILCEKEAFPSLRATRSNLVAGNAIAASREIAASPTPRDDREFRARRFHTIYRKAGRSAKAAGIMME